LTGSGSGIDRQPPRTPPVDPACAALRTVPAKVTATELDPDATPGRPCGSRKPLVMRVSTRAGECRLAVAGAVARQRQATG